MIITLNTETKEIKEIPQESDNNLEKDQLQAEILQIMLASLVGFCMNNYKNDDARKMYVSECSRLLEKMMNEAIEQNK